MCSHCHHNPTSCSNDFHGKEDHFLFEPLSVVLSHGNLTISACGRKKKRYIYFMYHMYVSYVCMFMYHISLLSPAGFTGYKNFSRPLSFISSLSIFHTHTKAWTPPTSEGRRHPLTNPATATHTVHSHTLISKQITPPPTTRTQTHKHTHTHNPPQPHPLPLWLSVWLYYLLGVRRVSSAARGPGRKQLRVGRHGFALSQKALGGWSGPTGGDRLPKSDSLKPVALQLARQRTPLLTNKASSI